MITRRASLYTVNACQQEHDEEESCVLQMVYMPHVCCQDDDDEEEAGSQRGDNVAVPAAARCKGVTREHRGEFAKEL